MFVQYHRAEFDQGSIERRKNAICPQNNRCNPCSNNNYSVCNINNYSFCNTNNHSFCNTNNYSFCNTDNHNFCNTNNYSFNSVSNNNHAGDSCGGEILHFSDDLSASAARDGRGVGGAKAALLLEPAFSAVELTPQAQACVTVFNLKFVS